MSVEDVPQQTVFLTSSRCMVGSAKGRCFRRSASILFPLVHFLFELLGLFFVDKAEPGEAFLQFKGVKEGSVLIVVPRIEDFLVPDDPAVGGRNIHHLEPVGVSHQVVGQNNGALQSRVIPFRAIGICNVELGDGDGLDFVGLLGDKALDSIFVVVVEDGGHVGGGAAGGRTLGGRRAARSRGDRARRS